MKIFQTDIFMQLIKRFDVRKSLEELWFYSGYLKHRGTIIEYFPLRLNWFNKVHVSSDIRRTAVLETESKFLEHKQRFIGYKGSSCRRIRKEFLWGLLHVITYNRAVVEGKFHMENTDYRLAYVRIGLTAKRAICFRYFSVWKCTWPFLQPCLDPILLCFGITDELGLHFIYIGKTRGYATIDCSENEIM